ncbi:Pfs NACHT and ankyrin domain protein [Penicillium cosmopolitanum]|uniref:Pfs NACHT and ankyrin domain protein n=1 Tax=Penicillium cosmopolitanum TaxID=1131564 RepID=A0A9W9VYP0_9EURO|nr:Pfs NACHT and ankyrin domain protein [Penicillium cosmopolitanum]KAJ5391857.1 Pfs NACHT and ankyrin domain protein [Penicillium cosmopolitanum]
MNQRQGCLDQSWTKSSYFIPVDLSLSFSNVTAQLTQRRNFTNKSLSHNLLKRIQSKVRDRADRILAQYYHKAAIEKVLISLLQNLNRTYQRMVTSIPADIKKDTIRLLQFLVYSKISLKLAEAKEVIATQIKNDSQGINIKRQLFCKTNVLDYCPSLTEHAVLAQEYEDIAQITGSELYYTYFIRLIAPAQDIISKGADVNTQGGYFSNALQAASSRGYQEIIKLLLNQGADINTQSDINTQGGHFGNALQASISKGYQKIVKLLLEQGADINTQGSFFGDAL